MSFKSMNEVDNFRYDDCRIIKQKNNKTDLVLEVEALIVKSNNSQNSQFVESYADLTQIYFKNSSIVMGIKEGMKVYDANEKLIEEVKDVTLDDSVLNEVLNNLSGMYLQGIERIEDTNDYVLFLEKANEDQYDTLPSDTYQIKVHCADIIISWDRYLNRVQQM
ncbi:MAG: hypothetical protein J6K43_12885 [Lachnospiraceae bacterium]|nr:hypothetical protein [Lachnospiraceae bacterium]